MKKVFFAFVLFFAFVFSRTPCLAEPQLSPEQVCTKTLCDFSTKAFATETVDQFGGIVQLLRK